MHGLYSIITLSSHSQYLWKLYNLVMLLVDAALADAVIVGAEDKADSTGLDTLRCGPAKMFPY